MPSPAYDPDIIAYLYPHEGEGFQTAKEAIYLLENQHRYLAGRNSEATKSRKRFSRQERAVTKLSPDLDDLEDLPCLVLRFSQGPKHTCGLVFGRGENVDVALPAEERSISNRHFALTFDNKHRLIVRDSGSLGGTAVTYNGETRRRVPSSSWLLTGPPILRSTCVVLDITDRLQFKVDAVSHDITSPDYINRVAKFRAGTVTSEDLELAMGTAGLTPPGPTFPGYTYQTSLPGDSNLFTTRLGEGSFGMVDYVWDAMSGEEWVVKAPRKNAPENQEVGIEFWRAEAAIMSSISHPHIVAFLRADFVSTPPRLEFEYVPGGALYQHRDFSTLESAQITKQLCSALDYLHNRELPIAHRDIKPENILISQRDGDQIHVKLADFGLFKQGVVPQSLDGSGPYMAPEMLEEAFDKDKQVQRYSYSIDIWSLAVVIAQLECKGTPSFQLLAGPGWSSTLRRYVEDHHEKTPSELLDLVLNDMLVLDPNMRSPPEYCRNEAQKLEGKLREESENSDGASITPKASRLNTRYTDLESTATPKASRLNTQSAICADITGSEVPTVILDNRSIYLDQPAFLDRPKLTIEEVPLRRI